MTYLLFGPRIIQTATVTAQSTLYKTFQATNTSVCGLYSEPPVSLFTKLVCSDIRSPLKTSHPLPLLPSSSYNHLSSSCKCQLIALQMAYRPLPKQTAQVMRNQYFVVRQTSRPTSVFIRSYKTINTIIKKYKLSEKYAT